MEKIKVNVVGRVDMFSGIGQQTNAFVKTYYPVFDLTLINTRKGCGDSSHLPADLQKTTLFREKEKEAAVSIYTDVLWNGQGDMNWTKVPPTPIKYASVVFDSDRLPIEWSDIVNNHFDGVFATTPELVDVCLKSKIKKPVIYLPIGLDLQPFLARKSQEPSEGKPYTYGFIGSYEPRKNVNLLFNTFTSVFGLQNSAVRLRIHLSYSFEGHHKVMQLINRFVGTNVAITFGHVSIEEYRALLGEIDCFVSFSRGEGYSIVPREFMAMGKPVILNDALAHNTICEAPGVVRIHAEIPEPAFYPQIDGRYFGVQFSPYPEDAERVWRDFHDRRVELQSTTEARRKWASQFDYDQIKTVYRNIVNPPAVYLDSADAVTEDGLYLSDERLIKKYYELGLVKSNEASSTIHVRSRKEEKIVVIANDGGFYSVFNRLISYLTWTLTRNPGAIVLPDWRLIKMKEHWKTDTFTSFCYGRENDGNIFLKLFQPLPYDDVDESAYNDEKKLYMGAMLKDDFNEKDEPLLTYTHAYKLYRRPDFQKWRTWYHRYYSKYIVPNPHISDYVEKFKKENMSGRFVIGAHVRHPSHSIEQPGGRIPTVKLYFEIIDNEIKLARNAREKPFVFLATDQESVVQLFLERYGDMLIYRNDVMRTSLEQDTHYERLDGRHKNQEGFQIQHLTAADPHKWNTRMGEEVIIDTMLLARSSVFVHITSNIATAAAYMNPTMKMVYCE